jgi:CRISPR/Cas system endoribonuclease Cas6 (RAMP superfamily)
VKIILTTIKMKPTVAKNYHFLLTPPLKVDDIVIIESLNRKGRIKIINDTVILIQLEGKITGNQFHTLSPTLLNTLKKVKR